MSKHRNARSFIANTSDFVNLAVATEHHKISHFPQLETVSGNTGTRPNATVETVADAAEPTTQVHSMSNRRPLIRSLVTRGEMNELAARAALLNWLVESFDDKEINKKQYDQCSVAIARSQSGIGDIIIEMAEVLSGKSGTDLAAESWRNRLAIALLMSRLYQTQKLVVSVVDYTHALNHRAGN